MCSIEFRAVGNYCRYIYGFEYVHCYCTLQVTGYTSSSFCHSCFDGDISLKTVRISVLARRIRSFTFEIKQISRNEISDSRITEIINDGFDNETV